MHPSSRAEAARQGRETVEALLRKRYRAPSGAWVSIRSSMESAVRKTVAYPPDEAVALPGASGRRSIVELQEASTLSAARQLVERGCDPVVLNFASARHPGGGFLAGARAQEESLARSTGLFACIEHQPMYSYHRLRPDPMYSHHALYSPGVPVIRDDEGRLLEEPFPIGVITCAAPNASRLPEGRRRDLERVFRERIARVLAIGVHHGHESIVLGAWGCGAFRNDPAMVARLFHDALRGPFSGAYEIVVFAVLDPSETKVIYRTFEQILS